MVYVLTETGKERITEIILEYNDCQIAIKTGLHRHTISKIINGNKGVRLKSLLDFFRYFDLKLEETDYEKFQNYQNTTNRNTEEFEEPQNANSSQNLGVKKYVKRSLIEQQVYKSLLLTNCILKIKAPKNMGKTILINQVLDQVTMKKNYQTVSISFRDADNSHLSELNELLRWLCANVSSQLELPVELDDWDNSTKTFGSKTTCNNYFEKYLLPELESHIVLFLDNLELLFFKENICQDFLAMLRSWNDKASRNSLWEKLRLVISYAANTDIKMNPNQSPFNIGTTIELPEFTLKEVQKFAKNYQLNLDNSQVRELTNMVGGHPYLLELTFRSLKTCNGLTLEKVLETAPTKDGIYHNPHLQEYLAILKQNPGEVLKESSASNLAKVFLNIIKGKDIGNMESHAIKTLMNLGLVKYQDGKILVRCELYRLYFKNYLGDV